MNSFGLVLVCCWWFHRLVNHSRWYWSSRTRIIQPIRLILQLELLHPLSVPLMVKGLVQAFLQCSAVSNSSLPSKSDQRSSRFHLDSHRWHAHSSTTESHQHCLAWTKTQKPSSSCSSPYTQQPPLPFDLPHSTVPSSQQSTSNPHTHHQRCTPQHQSLAYQVNSHHLQASPHRLW